MKTASMILCLWLLGASAALAAPAVKLQPGTPTPDWLGPTPDKQDIRVSDYRGQVLVVSFWASWCHYCLSELPVLDRLQKQAGDRLQVIAVNVKDLPKDYNFVRKQLKDTDITFTRDRDGDINEAYGVRGYPCIFIIDQEGRLAYTHSGYGEETLKTIITQINSVLAGEEAPAADAGALTEPPPGTR